LIRYEQEAKILKSDVEKVQKWSDMLALKRAQLQEQINVLKEDIMTKGAFSRLSSFLIVK
jgi:hypothetical protein